MAHILAISNQKGGVGKTTTAVNLAACLASSGHDTLLVDMDPQGNATSAVGVNSRGLTTSLYRTLIGLDTPDPIALHDRMPNLWILPSNMDLAAAELEFFDLENRERRLRSVLRSLDREFEYIILDSPPSLSLLSINTLTAADRVIVPVQAEFLALEGLSHVTATINRIRQSLNPDLQLLGIVVTMFDGRTRLAQEVIQHLGAIFGPKVFKTRLVRSVRLSEAPSHGLPIIQYEPKSAGAIAYTQFSQEVIHACEEASAWART